MSLFSGRSFYTPFQRCYHNAVWLGGAAFVFAVIAGVAGGRAVATAAEVLSRLPEVVEIVIEGTNKISPATVRDRMKTRPGGPLSEATVREDIKSIYKLGYFDDVRIDSRQVDSGVRLIVRVKERPVITEIKIEGAEALLVENLQPKLSLKAPVFYDPQKVAEDVSALHAAYEEEGYFAARIIPVLSRRDSDAVALTFLIREGQRAKIRSVGFEGARAFSERRLKRVVASRRYRPLTSWLTRSGWYRPDRIEEDQERLRDWYLDRGYLDMQVGSPDIRFSSDGRNVHLVYPIREGAVYEIESVEFEHGGILPESTLRDAARTAPGRVFSRKVVRDDIRALTDLYGEQGYALSNVFPQFVPDPEHRKVRIRFRIDEGAQIRVRRIDITGNDKTRDKVIRRELRINEQGILNTRALRRSIERIRNLNFFETVDIQDHPVDESQVDLEVKVKEQMTGNLGIGGGYSSVDRLVGFVEVTQGNLFGRGQLLRFRAEAGGLRSTYSLTFREPYLFDRPVSGTVDLFDTTRSFDTYKEGRRGGDFVLGRSFGEHLSSSISYTLQRVNLLDIKANAPQQIKDQANLPNRTSAVGLSVAYDTRDFFFDPSRGGRLSASLEYAGTFLGGDYDYVKPILDASRFFPVGWSTVLSVHGRLGYVAGIEGDILPVGERFYVGGINTVRGFEFGRAGPVDPLSGTPTGGNKELIANLEYLVPLGLQGKAKWVLFADAGRAFNENERIKPGDLRYSAGFGLRLLIPMPVRLEFGYNLDRQAGEQGGLIPDFTIGTLF